jgi:mannuronan synthase
LLVIPFAQHAVYLAICALLAFSVPTATLGNAQGVVVVVGAIGIWRYGWAATNFARALMFKAVAYPRRRRAAFAAYARHAHPAHAYFLTTSYKIEPETTQKVYRSIFAAAQRSAGGATIVASVVETADARLIRQIFDTMHMVGSGVTLIVDQIPGTGKRDALARSLRLIARQAP